MPRHETDGPSSGIALIPELMEDNNGGRFTEQLGAAMQRGNAFIEGFMERHEGETPKPVEVICKVRIGARGPTLREVVWGIEVKTHDTDPECIQIARTDNGHLVTDARPGRQARMHLTLEELGTTQEGE